MEQAQRDFAVGLKRPDEAAAQIYTEIEDRVTFAKWYAIEYDDLTTSETYAELVMQELDEE